MYHSLTTVVQIQDLQRKIKQTMADTQLCQAEVERILDDRDMLKEQHGDIKAGSWCVNR